MKAKYKYVDYLNRQTDQKIKGQIQGNNQRKC